MGVIRYKKIGWLLLVFLLAFVSLLACFQRSIIANAASGSTTVYITEYGEKYHSSTCQYLYESKISISLSKAVERGYSACSVCNPPRLTSGGGTTNTTPYTPSNSSSDDERWIPIFWAVVITLVGGGFIIKWIREDRQEKRRKEEQEEEEDEK